MGNELALAANLTAIVLGLVTSIAAFTASRKYYAGPWKSVVMWMTWGVSLLTVMTIMVFSDWFFEPGIENIPAWMKYPTAILGYLCLLNCALAMRRMAEFYSSKSYEKVERELKVKRK
ncbi:MAG: hypothetical protein QXF56_02345 [Candidatus Micrarchaeia archaeon]